MIKEFNLEQAKAGKAVCTRDGRRVRILCFDLKDNNFPICAAVEEEEGIEYPYIYTLGGGLGYNRVHYADLMMADGEDEQDLKPSEESEGTAAGKEKPSEESEGGAGTEKRGAETEKGGAGAEKEDTETEKGDAEKFAGTVMHSEWTEDGTLKVEMAPAMRVEGIYEELKAVYKAKNHDYGNSFDESLDSFGLVASVVRISDKWNRIKALWNKDGEAKVKESLEDTLLDMANYCVMTVAWMRRKMFQQL